MLTVINFFTKLFNLKHTGSIFLCVVAIGLVYISALMPILEVTKLIIIAFIITVCSWNCFWIETNNIYQYNKPRISVLLCMVTSTTGVLSLVVFFSGLCVFVFEPEETYTIKHIYNPLHIIKDSNKVIVFGTSNNYSSKIVELYFSQNLKICKDEQYTAWHFRLKDRTYICK